MIISPTDLRTSQNKTDVFLHVLQPATLLSALVNGSPDRGALSFSYDTGTSPSGFSDIAFGMTIIFTTQYGEQRGIIRTISGTAASGTITFFENNFVLSNNDPFVIVHNFEPHPQPPSIRGGIFYKFWDGSGIAYSDQNSEPPPVVIMGSHRVGDIPVTGSATLQVTTSGDDGYALNFLGGSLNTTGNDVVFGLSSGPASGFWRFTNPDIPPGVTILSAIPTVVAHSTQTGAITTVISGDDEDNATAPTTYAGYNAKPITSATVNLNTSATWTANQIIALPDIKTIIQEIIDRAGYVLNNAIQIFIKDNSSAGLKAVYSYNGSPSKALSVAVSWVIPTVFNLDASDSYAVADGATIASVLWTCIHNGGGTSGITIASPTSAVTTLSIAEPDQYWLTCAVTDSNGKTSTSHRAIFTNAPYVDFVFQAISGDWDSGGYKTSLNVTGDMSLEDFPDWTLVVISQKNYFDDVESYVNLWGISDEILLCGYLRQDTDADNWGAAESGGGTTNTSFTVTTIDDLLNNITPLGSVSIGAVVSPTHWYEYASWMTAGRSIHHYIFWHTYGIFQCCDVLGLVDNSLGVKQTDYTEGPILQGANNFAFNRGIFAKLMADNLGRLHLVQDAQMLSDADRAALDTIFTITEDDISGMVTVVRDPEGQVSFTQLDGFSFDGSISTPFISIVPGYRESGTSYIMPSERGGSTASVSNQILADQTDANVRVGRYHALQNNNPVELRFTNPSNYSGAFTILPVGWYEWGIADGELKRDTPINGRLTLCRHIDIAMLLDTNGTYSGSLQTSVVLQPEAIGIPGIQANYPTSFPPPSPPDPGWTPPTEGDTGEFLFGYGDGNNELAIFRAGHLSAGGTITTGSEISITADGGDAVVCNLSATKAVAFYNNDAGQGVVKVINKASLVITFGALAYNVDAGIAPNSICGLTDTLAIAAYSGHIVAMTIAGDVITVGTPVTFSGNPISVARLSATKFIATGGDTGGTTPVNCVIGTVSGTTITLGTPGDGSNEFGLYTSVVGLTDELAVIAYISISAFPFTFKPVRVASVTVSGTAFTLTDDIEIDGTMLDYIGHYISRLSSSRAAIVYGDTSSSPYSVLGIGVQCTSGGVLSLGSPISVSTGTVSRFVPVVCSLSGQKVVTSYYVYDDPPTTLHAFARSLSVSGTSLSNDNNSEELNANLGVDGTAGINAITVMEAIT